MMTKASIRTERWLRKYNEPNPIKRQYVSSQVAYEFELQLKPTKRLKKSWLILMFLQYLISRISISVVKSTHWQNDIRVINFRLKSTLRCTNTQEEDWIKKFLKEFWMWYLICLNNRNNETTDWTD